LGVVGRFVHVYRYGEQSEADRRWRRGLAPGRRRRLVLAPVASPRASRPFGRLGPAGLARPAAGADRDGFACAPLSCSLAFWYPFVAEAGELGGAAGAAVYRAVLVV